MLCTIFFFFNDTATTEIYTLSLHDALPISPRSPVSPRGPAGPTSPRSPRSPCGPADPTGDRKSTRLNSSHSQISYAVFCLKKKQLIQLDHDSTHLLIIKLFDVPTPVIVISH